jgi:phosphoribosylaminoimidazole-succinocarboxamide synthase
MNTHLNTAITSFDFPDLPLFKTGKVRSVYDLGDTLLMVTSDRISAFDWILPSGIPNKGKLLTQMTAKWCEFLKDRVPNHLISINAQDFPKITQPYQESLDGRSMWVKKTDLIEVECVARGYLVGSGWAEYQQSGTVCGIPLPPGIRQAERLPQPIFTPAYKAPMGSHDENISFERMCELVGNATAETLRSLTLDLYAQARDYALTKGIIIADTKFEFGKHNGQIILIDEILTPDSSRFWDVDSYQPGGSPPSFDKQIVRDYLQSSGWDKESAPPQLPKDIIEATERQYQSVYDRLFGVKSVK